MTVDPQPTGLARGKGRTTRPRVYAGCLPCAQGRSVADLEHANIWLVTHWKRCRHSLPAVPLSPLNGPRTRRRRRREGELPAQR
jgi:hypothetical protein